MLEHLHEKVAQKEAKDEKTAAKKKPKKSKKKDSDEESDGDEAGDGEKEDKEDEEEENAPKKRKRAGGVSVPEEWPWEDAKRVFQKPDVTPADQVEVRFSFHPTIPY